MPVRVGGNRAIAVSRQNLGGHYFNSENFETRPISDFRDCGEILT